MPSLADRLRERMQELDGIVIAFINNAVPATKSTTKKEAA